MCEANTPQKIEKADLFKEPASYIEFKTIVFQVALGVLLG
jgi:hypothetical protein